MMRISKGILTATAFTLATILAGQSPASAQCASRNQITGIWHSDDGGSYSVRRVGHVIWWVGESADGGQSFKNVYRGEINGNTITGEWMDVQNANGFHGDTNRGTLTLQLEGDLQHLFAFNKVSDTGGFGGRRWSFPCNDTGGGPSR